MAKEFSTLDPLEVLGVTKEATKKEIRKAFRKKALEWHPDKHGSGTSEDQKRAELKFKQVAWAYELLISENKRNSFFSYSTTFSRRGDSVPFDFSSYENEWESDDWHGFWTEKDPNDISDECRALIKEMWDKERALSEQERMGRCTVRIIHYKDAVIPWATYSNTISVPSGVGRDMPFYSPLFNEKVACWKGSLVGMDVDAIVNAANVALAGGGGIDGAIHLHAGRDLYNECGLIGGCNTGNVAITRGYLLPATYIIHACGPIGKHPKYLSSCYSRALDTAVEYGIRTIAFPCISTGAYGYPLESACNVALQTTRNWLETKDNASKIDLIVFGCFLGRELQVFEKWLQWYFPSSATTLGEDVQPEFQHLLQAPMAELLFPSSAEDE